MRYLIVIVAFLLVSCGYKPVSVITKDLIGESVYVDVVVLKSDPKNAVAIKDGIREAVIKRLNRNLTSKENAKTIIIASIASVNFLPTSFDKYGFTNAYEARVDINYQVRFENGEIAMINCTGTSDFRMNQQIQDTIYTDSVISNKDRFKAISEASKESFDELIAKLALRGKENVKSNQ